MSMWTIPVLHCVGCYRGVCNATCLATHRDRYCCHNPSCMFHAPCPARPEPDERRTTQPAITSSTTEQAPTQVATPPANDAAEAGRNPTGTSGDSNVILRETITREWRLDGRGTEPAQTSTPAAVSPTSTQGEPPTAPPAMFTIEEFEAQARLLDEARQAQGQRAQVGQQGGGVRRNGGDNEAGPTTTIRINFH